MIIMYYDTQRSDSPSPQGLVATPPLPQVLIGYLEEWLALYASAPRRFASINTMVAHEHFMLRLPALDDALAAMLERLARNVLQVGSTTSVALLCRPPPPPSSMSAASVFLCRPPFPRPPLSPSRANQRFAPSHARAHTHSVEIFCFRDVSRCVETLDARRACVLAI